MTDLVPKSVSFTLAGQPLVIPRQGAELRTLRVMYPLETAFSHFEIRDTVFAWLQTQSFSYSQQISVPAKGEYFLRMGMRDVTNDRVGTVELPVAEVAKLPALSEAVPAPAAANPQK